MRLPPPTGSSHNNINNIHPAALAFLGDAVFETYARRALLWPPKKQNDLHTQVKELCCAQGQSDALDKIHRKNFQLAEIEIEYLRRGRNASKRGPRTVPPSVYRAASSLETLVGFLSLTNETRCAELMDFVIHQ